MNKVLIKNTMNVKKNFLSYIANESKEKITMYNLMNTTRENHADLFNKYVTNENDNHKILNEWVKFCEKHILFDYIYEQINFQNIQIYITHVKFNKIIKLHLSKNEKSLICHCVLSYKNEFLLSEFYPEGYNEIIKQKNILQHLDIEDVYIGDFIRIIKPCCTIDKYDKNDFNTTFIKLK